MHAWVDAHPTYQEKQIDIYIYTYIYIPGADFLGLTVARAVRTGHGRTCRPSAASLKSAAASAMMPLQLSWSARAVDTVDGIEHMQIHISLYIYPIYISYKYIYIGYISFIYIYILLTHIYIYPIYNCCIISWLVYAFHTFQTLKINGNTVWFKFMVGKKIWLAFNRIWTTQWWCPWGNIRIEQRQFIQDSPQLYFQASLLALCEGPGMAGFGHGPRWT